MEIMGAMWAVIGSFEKSYFGSKTPLGLWSALDASISLSIEDYFPKMAAFAFHLLKTSLKAFEPLSDTYRFNNRSTTLLSTRISNEHKQIKVNR